MKKILIGFCLTILAVTLKAQVLKPVKIDTVVTVSLPAEYAKRDTLGQAVYSGTASLGYIVVIKSPNPPGDSLRKEKDLNKVFKQYIKQLQQTAPAQSSVLNSKDTIVNNVEVRDFDLSTSDPSQGDQIRRFRILYTKPFTYTFEYVYPVAREDIARKESNDFFASVKTSPSFNGTDQFTMYGKLTGMSAIAKIALVAVMAMIFVVLIFIIRRRLKKEA